MIPLQRAIDFQHVLWDDQLPRSLYIVDMTCGNGNDTLYVAQGALTGAHIYALDIQEQAILATKDKIRRGLERNDVSLSYHKSSHDEWLASGEAPTEIDLMVGNLGYLPKGDHSIMTNPCSTIKAIQLGMERLSQCGLITIVAYPGTEWGLLEMEALESFLRTIPQEKFQCSHWGPMNQKNQPPQLFIIRKR